MLNLLTSCKKKRVSYVLEGEPQVIHLSSSSPHISLTSIIHKLKVISLETNKNSLISGPWAIQKLIFKDNKYFILDDTYAAIKVFDTSGRYLYDIGKLGVKKDQFTRVEDIVYSPYHNSILVLCNRPNKLSEFTLNGNFISSKRLEFFAHSLVLQGPNSRMFYVNQNRSKLSGTSNILLTDTANNIEAKLFEMPKNFKSVIKASGGLFASENGIFFNSATSQVYYQIINDTAKPMYKIEYGYGEVPKNINQDSFFNNLSKYSFQYSRFAHTDRFIGFNYLHDEVNTAFVNKLSGQVFQTDPSLDSLNVLFRSSMFQSGEDIIMILDLKSQRRFINRNAKFIISRFPEFKKVIRDLNKNSNPALLIFQLKN